VRRGRVVGIGLLAVVGFTAVGAEGAPTPSPHTGQATTTIQLPRIVITDANGTARSIDIGALIAKASTDSGPVAALGLNGPAVLGTTLPGWQVDASAGSKSGDQDIVLSTGQVNGDVGLVNYGVSTTADSAQSSYGALTATASTSPMSVQANLGQHGVTASVTPNTSTGSLELTISGLQLDLGDLLPADVISALPLSGLVDIVSALGLSLPAGAGGLNTALSTLGTDLTSAKNLADQLTTAHSALAGLLGALPTTSVAQQQLATAQSTLANDLAALQSAQQQLASDTAIAQQLQAQVTTLTAAVTAAQQQVDTATDAVTSWTAQISSLTAQLNSLLGNPLKAAQIVALTTQLTDAQSQLAAAQSALSAAQTTLTNAQAALAPVQQQAAQAAADVTADQTFLTTVQQNVSADQAAVTSAQQALDALVASISGNQAVLDAQAMVNTLTTSLTTSLTSVTSDVTALPNLANLRDQLLATLTAAPLVDVGTIGATLTSTADDNSGSGVISCTITGASVLGQPIPGGSCASLVSQFGAVAAAVAGAVGQLPLAAPIAPVVNGLTAATTLTNPTAADTVTTGTASLAPLHLAVPTATLSALADSAVTGLATTLAGTQQSFAALGLPAITSALAGTLGTLAGTVGALPTGTGLAGLHTLGIDASLVGLSTTATHYRALNATPPPVTPPPVGVPPVTPPIGNGNGNGTDGGTVDGGVPGAGAPKAPDPGKTPSRSPGPATPRDSAPEHEPLPFTGDNTALDIAAALVVMLAGAHLLRLGRRPGSTARSTR